jgi:hypothetical protein
MNDACAVPSSRLCDVSASGDSSYDEAPLGEHDQSVVAQAVTSLDIRGRMTRHPYQTLLIAAGVGYVLGGGLFTRLTANVFRVGMRVGGHPLVQRELFGVAQALLRGPS